MSGCPLLDPAAAGEVARVGAPGVDPGPTALVTSHSRPGRPADRSTIPEMSEDGTQPASDAPTSAHPGQPVPLRAGPLSLVFDRGELRWLRLGGREVLRGIYVAVRPPTCSLQMGLERFFTHSRKSLTCDPLL